MASSLVKSTVAATAQPAKNLYTVLLTTPRCATPTFLYDVQQSDIDPLFVGVDGIFFRKTNPTQWGFSHILLLSGAEPQIPEHWRLRQKWSFTVEAASEYVPNEEGAKLPAEDFKKQAPRAYQVEEPTDLKNTVKYWLSSRSPGVLSRFYVLNFAEFSTPESGERYRGHLAALQAPEKDGDRFGAQVHLSGRVASTTQLQRFDDPQAHDADAADWFALMSFASEKEYGEYLMSEEYRNAVGEGEGDGEIGVKMGMVLTQELKLPHKEKEIQKFAWDYGNPYEPYGEDWFG